MRQPLLIIAIGLALLTVTVTPALANHNAFGARMTIGDPDPSVTQEPDVPEDLTPVYNYGGTHGAISWQGTFPRVAPADQTGVGMGTWVGFIDLIVEYPGVGAAQCFPLDDEDVGVLNSCNFDNDPLYRINPEEDNEACETLESRLDLGEDPVDTGDDPCGGNGHGFFGDFFPGVRLERHTLDVIGGEGSGFIYPGIYQFYTYLFGDGSGPATGQAPFDYLSADLCADHLDKLKDLGKIPASRDTSQAEKCKLITPKDLKDHQSLKSAGGSTQWAAVCLGAPDFVTLSGETTNTACENINEFQQFFPDTDSPFYADNKPGWYLQTGYIDPFGSTLEYTDTPTVGGNRTNIALNFHAYVNPVRPDDSLSCAYPGIATSAPDEISTGWVENPDNTWTRIDNSIHYLVEANDLDVYMAPAAGAADGADPVVDLILETLPDLPEDVQSLIDSAQEAVNQTLQQGDDVTEPIVDEVNAAAARVGPTHGNTAEPNADGDNSLTEVRTTQADRCDPVLGLTNEGKQLDFLNLLDATVSQAGEAAPLKDPTAFDESGLPAKAGDQSFNPWHPSAYTLDGLLRVFKDGNANGQFDTCPPGNDEPSASQPDKCVAYLDWDMYNPAAVLDDGTLASDRAISQGYTDPLGLYFVLKVTGPTLAYNTFLAEDSPNAIEERTRVITALGQNCIVGTSVGLTELADANENDINEGERFRGFLGLSTSAPQSAIVDTLCGDVTGEKHLIGNAFVPGIEAGGFTSAIGWTTAGATAAGANLGPGDGLTFNAVITVQGGTVTTNTAQNLKLGGPDATETLETTWANGDKSYLWTDVDPFESTVDA